MEDQNRKVGVMAGNLPVDAATAEVLRAFAVAEFEAVLLKGPALARWLYTPDDPRSYVDCDLLVRPDQFEAAGNVLAELGFAREFDDRALPAWWGRHSVEWSRKQDGAIVDLHRTIPGVGVEPDVAWDILTTRTDVIAVANHPAPVLNLPARVLHVALHAAQHGALVARPLVDLDRAVVQVDEALWRCAIELAERLDAVSALTAGLHITPSGRDLAIRLGLHAVPSVATRLQATTAPPAALGLEQLARADGLRTRIEILRWKFVPPPSYIRHWHPMASRGRTGLLLAYMYRPLWILRSAPRAVTAWRQARRLAGTEPATPRARAGAPPPAPPPHARPPTPRRRSRHG